MATYAVPENQARCARCGGDGVVRVPEQARRCERGANGLLCDYEEGHPQGHATSLNGDGVLDYLTRGMVEAETTWAREFVDRVSAATIAGADADLRSLAEEIAHRLTFWSRSAIGKGVPQ